MNLVQYFSFLPFGKYAFYIWLSYIIFFSVFGILIYRFSRLHMTTKQQLLLKYNRENND